MGLTIVGLGPGDGRLLTRQAWDLLTQTDNLLLRTQRHPAVADLPPQIGWRSFDDLYDQAEAFDQVYAQIVASVLQAAQSGNVVYAVPGHPLVGEATVTALLTEAAAAAVPVTVVAGLSFVEPTLTLVGADALDGLQLFDAIDLSRYQHPPLNPDQPALLAQVYNRLLASELKLSLMTLYPEDHQVCLVRGAGTAAETAAWLPLYELDRRSEIDHLTSLYLPPLPYAASLSALAETVAVLRGPNGCPWDQEQTPQSLRAGLLEEASELLAALDKEDSAELCEELGDMFFHLVMQAQMAAEAGDFTLTEVLAGIDAKLKRRHPHVFADLVVANTAEVLQNWEAIKAEEKGLPPQRSLLDNLPLVLPALARSQKIQERVRRVGFDWPQIQGVMAKLAEELAELEAAETAVEQQAEFGDVLFVLANLASWLGLDAEAALREANLRFERRFRALEHLAADRGLELSQMGLAGLDELWQEVKNSGRE
jgi:tetrapyrrole methylase family protein / MazG family protein